MKEHRRHIGKLVIRDDVSPAVVEKLQEERRVEGVVEAAFRHFGNSLEVDQFLLTKYGRRGLTRIDLARESFDGLKRVLRSLRVSRSPV